MHRPTWPLAALLLATLAPPAFAAGRPEPLVDLAPQRPVVFDRVGPARAATRAPGAGPPRAYRTADGQTVSIQFSRGYTPDDAVAQSYVDFLGSLPHGSELRRLKVLIATPRQVRAACGGEPGTLACYDTSTSRMTVPGEEVGGAGGVTTSYVIAHEYGHHVARWRSNAPFPALAFGAKRWASQEMVCLNTLKGRLFPGNEGQRYLANPGEAFADAYAHLKYPDAYWQFTSLLRPDRAGRAALLADVLYPWTGPVARTFRGRFTPGSPRTRVFRIVLRLDGSLRVALHGPRGANFDVGLSSLGRRRGHTTGPTARDVYAQRYACRELRSESVDITIARHRGLGAFSVTATYAG